MLHCVELKRFKKNPKKLNLIMTIYYITDQHTFYNADYPMTSCRRFCSSHKVLSGILLILKSHFKIKISLLLKKKKKKESREARGGSFCSLMAIFFGVRE